MLSRLLRRALSLVHTCPVAEVVVIEPDMLEFTIDAEAGPQVQATINPRAHFVWIAPPGMELKRVIKFEIQPLRRDGTAW